MRALLLLVLAACAAEARSPEALTPPVQDALAPLFVPTREGTYFDLGLRLESPAPSWVAQRMRRPMPADFVNGGAVIGARHTLLPTVQGWFMTSNAGLVAGPLPFPRNVGWVGLDGRDGVYVATDAGSLFHVERPELAHEWHRYTARAQVSGARSWDAAGRFVVALGSPPATGSVTGATPLLELWVSADYGRRFRKRTLPGDAALEAFVRADGFLYVSVVSAEAEGDTADAAMPKAFVSADAGASWQPFPRPANGMQRLGGMLYGTDDEGVGYLITRAGRPAPLPAPPCVQRWSQRLLQWTVPWPEPELCFEVDAAAPESSEASETREAACTCRDPPITRGMRRMSYWLRDGFFRPDPRFEPPVGQARFGVLDVATCSSRDRVSTEDSRARGCADDAAWLAKPVVAIRDQVVDRLSFVALPDGLWARSVLDAGGMAVVLARGDAGPTRLFTLDDEGGLHEEAAVPFDVGSLLRAADGTLVLLGSRAPRLGTAAFLREPVELGAPSPWRDISVERAVTYLPLTGGRALVGSESDSNRSALLLSVDEPAGRRSLARVTADRDRQDSQLAFDGEHLFLQAKPNAEWFAIRADGGLVVSSSCFITGSCAESEE